VGKDISDWWRGCGGKRRLVEFLIEQGQEYQYRYAYDSEHSEGDIAEYPQSASGTQVSVGIEEADAAGNEKYERQYHEKGKHSDTLKISVLVNELYRECYELLNIY